jgi:hypothetical protein
LNKAKRPELIEQLLGPQKQQQPTAPGQQKPMPKWLEERRKKK